MTDVSVEELYKQFCLDMLDAIEKWGEGEDTPNWFTETCGLCYNVNSWETRSDNTAVRLYYFQKELFSGVVSPFNDGLGELGYEVERELNIIYKNEARLAWLRKYAGKEG